MNTRLSVLACLPMPSAYFAVALDSYQAWHNILRTNMNKDDLSPWQIISKLKSQTNPQLVQLLPLMLDWLSPDCT